MHDGDISYTIGDFYFTAAPSLMMNSTRIHDRTRFYVKTRSKSMKVERNNESLIIVIFYLYHGEHNQTPFDVRCQGPASMLSLEKISGPTRGSDRV